jgi:hypothetical protein
MSKLINEFDEIIRWPKKPSVKKIVINWLSNKFNGEIKYSEKEVNEILDRHHSFNDIALLRRELVSRKFLSRKDDGSEYWKTNK